MGFFDDLKKIGETVGSLNQMAAEVSKTKLLDEWLDEKRWRAVLLSFQRVQK